MRKRPSRPARYASVDNKAIDTLKSILAVGLLTTLIRAKDGDDVTVEGLCKTRTEGREALSGAMRELVDDCFVVKFKIQRAKSEMVADENGDEVKKRGGSWYTTFTVDSIAFTAEDVESMLGDIYLEGNVRAHRIEPVHLDPKKLRSTWSPPTHGKPSVGPTSEDFDSGGGGEEADPEEQGGRPTDGFPTAGRPTVGDSAALIRNKTSSPHAGNCEDDAPSGRSPVGARSASTTGSYVREAEGDFVAPDNDSSPGDETAGGSGTQSATPARGQDKTAAAGKAKHTRQQLDLVRSVRDYYPSHMLTGWEDPDKGLKVDPLPEFRTLTDAILGALEGDVPGADRTPAQLGARIEQRWNEHGYASDYYAGKITTVRGAAVAMVRPLKPGDRYYCSNPRCDNGLSVDTHEACGTCQVRIEQKKAEKRQQKAQEAAVAPVADAATAADAPTPAMPAQRAKEVPPVTWWYCSKCPATGKGEPPVTGMCATCRSEAAVQWSDADEAAYEVYATDSEAPEEEPAAETEAPVVDEETARIRAELALQSGTPEQRALYCTPEQIAAHTAASGAPF